MERAHPASGQSLRLDPSASGFVDRSGELRVPVVGQVLEAGFAPDGRSFLFVEASELDGTTHLQVCRQLLDSAGGSAQRGDCWPGQAFASGLDGSVWIADLTGCSLLRVAMDRPEARSMLTLPEGLDDAAMAVAANGEILLAVRDRERGEVRVLHARPSWFGTRAVEIGAVSGQATKVRLAWHPTDLQAALLCVDPERLETSLYMFDARSRQVQRINERRAVDPLMAPVWLPGPGAGSLLMVQKDSFGASLVVQVSLPAGAVTELFPVEGVVQRISWTGRELLLEGEGIALVEPRVQGRVRLMPTTAVPDPDPHTGFPAAAGNQIQGSGKGAKPSADPAGIVRGAVPAHEQEPASAGVPPTPSTPPSSLWGLDRRSPDGAAVVPAVPVPPPPPTPPDAGASVALSRPLLRRERNLGGCVSLSFELPGDWLRREMDNRFLAGFEGVTYGRTGDGAAALHVVVAQPPAKTFGDLMDDLGRRLAVVVEDLRREDWPGGAGALATASDPLAFWRFMLLEDGGRQLVLAGRIPRGDPAARTTQVEQAFQSLTIEQPAGQSAPVDLEPSRSQRPDKPTVGQVPLQWPVRELRTEDLLLPGGDVLKVDLCREHVLLGSERLTLAQAPTPFDLEPVARIGRANDNDPRTGIQIGWRRVPAGMLLVDWLEDRARQVGPAAGEAKAYRGIGVSVGAGLDLAWFESRGRCRGRLIAAEAGGNLLFIQVSLPHTAYEQHIGAMLSVVKSLRLAGPAAPTMPVFPEGRTPQVLRVLVRRLEQLVRDFSPEAPAAAREFVSHRLQPALEDMRRAYTEGAQLPQVADLRQEAFEVLVPFDESLFGTLCEIEELVEGQGQG